VVVAAKNVFDIPRPAREKNLDFVYRECRPTKPNPVLQVSPASALFEQVGG